MPMRSILRTVALTLAIIVGTGAPSVEAQSLRQALEPFEGAWRGSFVVATPDGEMVDSLVATHRYRWDGAVQKGTLVDRYPASGRVDTLRARNYVADGRLVCEVTHPDGSTTVHHGRVRGNAIVWHRRTAEGVVESYRERIVDTPGGPEYRIDGFGVYPDGQGARSYVLFYGRYERIDR